MLGNWLALAVCVVIAVIFSVIAWWMWRQPHDAPGRGAAFAPGIVMVIAVVAALMAARIGEFIHAGQSPLGF